MPLPWAGSKWNNSRQLPKAVLFSFSTLGLLEKKSLFILKNAKYEGEKNKKRKPLDVTEFTDRKFQLRGNSKENIGKKNFTPFFN